MLKTKIYFGVPGVLARALSERRVLSGWQRSLEI